MFNQAESLRALGLEVDVVPIPGYASRASYLMAAARVAALNRRRTYDIVHAHYGHSAVVARLQLRSPLVITYLGSDLLAFGQAINGLSRRARLEASVFRQLARFAAATVTQSEEMERVLPSSCQRRNRVIPEGVDLELFRPAERDEARGELGWPVDERVVLFVDPDRPEKNYPLAQAVCDRLAVRMPELRLRAAAGVEPAAMPRLMAAADALLLTSRSEGGPSVVKEAMAMELPVVSTPVGIVRECLRGLPGLWVRDADVEALAEALEAALEGGRVPEARAAIASMSLQRVAERVSDVYASITG
jgi:glycosyltransferase involved in cell wall biosynthesis